MLAGVQEAYHIDGVPPHRVDNYAIGMNHQFARARHTTLSAQLGKLGEKIEFVSDLKGKAFGGSSILRRDIG